MTRLLCTVIFVVGIVAGVGAQSIPAGLRGKWIIQREVPTSTISCWGEKEAKRIIGTEIEYTAESFRWNNIVINHPAVDVALVTAQQFHDENSGQGANSSQVSFRQLGIRAAKAKQITINHPPAKLTGATSEIPGDVVLLKSRNMLVFSVCNVFFEAKRVPTSTRP